MGSARIAVFFVALLMVGVHVAHAQEGTGDPKAFIGSKQAPIPAAAAMPAAAAVAPAPPANAPVAPVVPEVAVPAAPPQPVYTLVASIDLATQRLTVTANGKQLHQWPVSSGTREFPTPVGNFRAEWSAKMWYSKTYDDAPMPHAVFFKNGAAIHATQATGSLGRPASHGCVRLAPANAAAFYKLVQQHGLPHTRIKVFGTPRFAPASVARNSDPRREQGYGTLAQRPQPPVYYGSAAYASSYRSGASSYPVQTAGQTASQSTNKVWPGDASPFAGANPYRNGSVVYRTR